MQNERQFLVTVGTTKFENLIKVIDQEEFYEFLDEKGFKKMIIQKGYGDYIPVKFQNLKLNNLKVEVSCLLTDFEKIIETSEYIISHGGAGNVLEALKYKKKLFVVVNDLLMDNHQIELAESLFKDNYIFNIKKFDDLIKDVKSAIQNEKSFILKEYPNFDLDTIPNLIYEMLNI
jgi:beta-1,4-N-acetylglucosaminyltransferase